MTGDNRKPFFDAIRKSLFPSGLSQSQVNGINDLLDEWFASPFKDHRHLAYILAGVHHETGARMVPVREGFASTDEGARAAVKKLYDAGRITRNYAAPVNGVSYYGRGRIQNTHHANYVKLQDRFGLSFVSKPDLLLNSAVDAKVTVYGHAEGIWTGRKLSDYINAHTDDPIGARRIVNGTDKAKLIAGYYDKYKLATALLPQKNDNGKIIAIGAGTAGTAGYVAAEQTGNATVFLVVLCAIIAGIAAFAAWNWWKRK